MAAVCELFAMSSRYPATVQMSLDELARRGGRTADHRDGWGIAYFEGSDVRLLREAEAASDSALVRFIQDHPPASELVVSHIRKATQGDRRLANCQPFSRELGGRVHVFAHNGNLDRPRLEAAAPLGDHRPVGDTDSEYAFCALLERLRPLWLGGAGAPPLAERLAALAAFAALLRPLGPANFLYADGDALFVHGHRRTQPDGAIRPPGLHVLARACARPGATLRTEGLAVHGGERAHQEVVLVASIPLTDEVGWNALAEGELIAVQGGRVATRIVPEP
jgi:predicted glutamine amidotransferase